MQTSRTSSQIDHDLKMTGTQKRTIIYSDFITNHQFLLPLILTNLPIYHLRYIYLLAFVKILWLKRIIVTTIQHQIKDRSAITHNSVAWMNFNIHTLLSRKSVIWIGNNIKYINIFSLIFYVSHNVSSREYLFWKCFKFNFRLIIKFFIKKLITHSFSKRRFFGNFLFIKFIWIIY